MTPDGPGEPRVTLVVAMRNESENIRRCLASIEAQEYPAGRLETFVFDGESTDGSMGIAQAFADGRPGWHIRTNRRRIQAAAWNAGIEAASGEIVGIVSAHAVLGPAYVRNAVEALTVTGADLVGGPVRAEAVGSLGRAIVIATSTPFGVGGARHHYLTEPAEVDTVFMGLARRATWLRYPFDEEFVRNQDDELSYRLLDGGGRIVCDPAIESSYRARSTLSSLWRQYFAYGCWKVRVIQKHPRQARMRHLIPLALVASLAGVGTLGLVSREARVGAAIELAAYATATGVSIVRYRDRGSPASIAMLVLAYPVMHFAYGSGMLLGIWRFRSRFSWSRRGLLSRLSGWRRARTSRRSD